MLRKVRERSINKSNSKCDKQRANITHSTIATTNKRDGSGKRGDKRGGAFRAFRARRAIARESPPLRVLRSVGGRALREERRQHAGEELRGDREERVAADDEHD